MLLQRLSQMHADREWCVCSLNVLIFWVSCFFEGINVYHNVLYFCSVGVSYQSVHSMFSHGNLMSGEFLKSKMFKVPIHVGRCVDRGLHVFLCWFLHYVFFNIVVFLHSWEWNPCLIWLWKSSTSSSLKYLNTTTSNCTYLCLAWEHVSV